MTEVQDPNPASESHQAPPSDPRKRAADADADAYRFGRPPENLPSFEPAPPSRVTDTAGVEVVDIDLKDGKARAGFLDMADKFYEGDENYISPLRMHFMKFLNPTKNPAFRNFEYRALFAMKNGEPVARMIVHIDRSYNHHHEDKVGFFGFFESANDRKAAHAILDEACRWLKDKGMVQVFGPFNFSTNHQVGLLVENFSRPPYVENTYNPAYYEELFTSYGFGKAKDLLTFMIDPKPGMETPKRQRIRKIADRVRKREGITVRPVSFKDAQAEITRMYEVYTKAWEKNWGFVPLDEEEFQFLMGDLKTVALPSLVLFVEVDGKPVGFCASLPNVNEKMPKNGRLFPFNWIPMLSLKKTTGGRLVSLGVLPEYRKRGLETIMFTETLLEGHRLGWTEGEIGWTLEDNDLVNRAIESMDGWLDRRYRILGLQLDG